MPNASTLLRALERAKAAYGGDAAQRKLNVLGRLNLKQPANGIARNMAQARAEAAKVGFPSLVRPSFVLGGRAMEICYDSAQFERFVAEYYAQNEPLMHGPASYKVATITRDTQEDAEADYQAISSGTDFAWLAGRHSTDDFKEKGGERDWLIATGFPATIRAELDSLPIGGVLPPASLEDGYVIMKLIGRKEGERLSLPDVTKRIRSTLERQKQLEAIDAAIKALRDPAKIDINQDALDKLQIIGPVQTGDAGEAAR